MMGVMGPSCGHVQTLLAACGAIATVCGGHAPPSTHASTPLHPLAVVDRQTVVPNLKMALHHRTASLSNEPPGFCALAETLDTWSKSDGCNSAPQFLSAFCKDHIVVSGGSLSLIVDNHTCNQPSFPQCGPTTHPFGGANIAGPSVFFGNISTVMKPAAGHSVTTGLVAYNGPSFGLGFNGADLTKVGLAVGNGHYNVALPFNAGKGFHRYDMIWGNGTAELYVDGIQMSMTPPLKPSDVPTTPMNLMIDTYACGASWCGAQLDCATECPTATAITYVAYTPAGTAEVPCTNPPPPPAFCDSGAQLAVAWTPLDECHKPPNNGTDRSSLAYMPDHVIITPGGEIELTASDNITEDSRGHWYCSKVFGISQGAGLVTGASLIHYGSVSVMLKTAGAGATTSIQLGDLNATGVGMTVEAVGTAPHTVKLQVNAVVATATLAFDPSMATHNYTVVWTPDNITFQIDGHVVHTVVEGVPQGAHAISVSAVPTTINGSAIATLTSVAYTPTATTPIECGVGWPIEYKPFWQDDFNTSILGVQWTVADNCTHGFPGQLYVKEGVVLEDGKLKLRAFEFPKNKTGPDGVSQRFGSGWVDSASNRSNTWITDCNMMNEKAIPFNFLYGKWEISAKMPVRPNGTAGHFWSALWLMPDHDVCWPKGGEVDILESDIWGQEPPYAPHAAYHWQHAEAPCFKDAALDGFGGVFPSTTPKTDYSQGFHVYSVEITPRLIIYSVDGEPYYVATSAHAEGVLPWTDMYLIMGNQLWKGWNFPTELPADFEIDYVKTWVPVESRQSLDQH